MSAVTELTEPTKISFLLFVVVFALNLLPAFAPPTWTAMSFIGLAMPEINFVLVALVAAIAATSGRIVLAKLSRVLVRQRLLSGQIRRNVDAIRLGIESRPLMTFSTVLGYSISPLPSNYLFIAYGLTSLPIAFLALPFFVGRVVSYFLISQLLLIPLIYGFTRIDWHAAFAEKRFKWLGKPE